MSYSQNYFALTSRKKLNFFEGTLIGPGFSGFLNAYYFVFDVMNAIFQYNVVLNSLNDKIIRYIF